MRIRKIPLRIRPDLDPPPQTVKLSEMSFKLSVYEYRYKLYSEARGGLQLVYEYHR